MTAPGRWRHGEVARRPAPRRRGPPRPAWVLALALATACATARPPTRVRDLEDALVERHGLETPAQWGLAVPGVKTRIRTTERQVALTLDACGGPGGSGFDEALVAFLEREAVPATVFVSVPWAEANPSAMARLAANPLFEIANHGWAHRPASVVGRSAYGLQGTRDVAELVEEIELGARALERLTGRKPRHFRPGTAHSDEVAVRVANELGYEVVGFSVVADAGPGANTGVQAALLSVVPGDIVLLHVNQPRSGRAPGLMTAVPVLQERGYRFVRLSEAVLEDGQAGPAPPPPLPIPAASR